MFKVVENICGVDVDVEDVLFSSSVEAKQFIFELAKKDVMHIQDKSFDELRDLRLLDIFIENALSYYTVVEVNDEQ